jgi:ribonuclease R
MRKAKDVVQRDADRLGTVQGHRDGFGFVIPDDGGEDIFLSEKEMSRVMHGDRVNVRVLGTDRRGRPEGQIVEVVLHANKVVIGRLLNENGVLIVAPEDNRIGHDILIPPKGQGIAKLGQVVSVEIIDYPDSYRQAIGRVVEVLGEIDDPGMEIEIAVRKYGVPHEFSAAAKKEAEALPDSVQQSDLEGRIDLRDVPLVTIDGADARDFDDAVYCEPLMYGKAKAWRLIVAIADVSHYVKPGHPLDDEGLLRATSVYFPRRVIPMLPEKISNGLCSLNPNVDRLCMVCDAVVDSNGIVLAYQFYPAVMHSAQRFTYDIVWEILSNSKGPESTRFAEFRPLLTNLYALYKILLEARHKRGAIEFETTETQIISNELGKIMRIEPRLRNEAHRLIEECMLTANVCAADFIDKNKHLSLYRVHGEPSEEKLQTLRQVLRTSGLSLDGGSKPRPKDFAKLMRDVKDRPDANMLQSVVLRAMQQAMYQPDNEGHFGLSYPAYSHFTSPIRRYPDLLTHRVIKSILAKKTYTPVLSPRVPLNLTLPRKGKARENAVNAKKSHSEAKEASAKGMRLPKGAHAALPIWGQLGVHCSSNERRADEASRDVEAWLKCYYMRDHLGQEYAGAVTSVASFGLFIQLENLFVEGMVHVTELGGDYFQYDEARQELRGERTGIRYRLGDRVHVLVSRVDLDARKIEFSLVKSISAEPGSSSSRRQIILASDTGNPNKKAAPKKNRPGSREPQKPSGINVNAAKSAGNLGANQAKSKASRSVVKSGKPSKPSRTAGKPAGSKPPVRATNARRK